MNDTPTVIGAFVTVILAFLGITKFMLNQATKDREADRQERKELSKAIASMAKNTGEQTVAIREGTEATNRGADEAKERNGHLAELIIQSTENTRAIAETATNSVIDAVQHVELQKVEHQTVAKAEIIDSPKK